MWKERGQSQKTKKIRRMNNKLCVCHIPTNTICGFDDARTCKFCVLLIKFMRQMCECDRE